MTGLTEIRTTVAMGMANLPKLETLFLASDEFSGVSFDEALLVERQIDASQIEELHELVHKAMVPDYPVMLCRLPYSVGCVFVEGQVTWPLVFLDSTKCNSAEELGATYIHEVAHLLANDNDHDFVFALTNAYLRAKAGMKPSQSEYDYRGCSWDNLITERAMRLSTLISRRAMDEDVPVALAADMFRCFVSRMGSQFGEQGDGEIEGKFVEYMPLFLSECSNTDRH